jgi:hypothetical protein
VAETKQPGIDGLQRGYEIAKAHATRCRKNACGEAPTEWRDSWLRGADVAEDIAHEIRNLFK